MYIAVRYSPSQAVGAGWFADAIRKIDGPNSAVEFCLRSLRWLRFRRFQLPYDEKKSGYDSFVIELPASQADVLKAVREVADDDTIHGTLEYEKDPILSGAEQAK